MKPISKAVCTVAIPGVLLVVGIFYLSTHGIQENGWVSVSMTSSVIPAESNLVGRTLPIAGIGTIQVTTISKNLNANGSVESYRVHADVHCRSKQWLFIDDLGWRHAFLASAQEVHHAIRTAASLPDHAVTHLDSDLLQR